MEKSVERVCYYLLLASFCSANTNFCRNFDNLSVDEDPLPALASSPEDALYAQKSPGHTPDS